MSDGLNEPRLGSLRDAYSPVATEWTFSNSSTTSSSPSAAGGSSATPAWSGGPAPPKARVLDLQSYPSDDFDSGSVLDTRAALKWLVSAAVLQYATTGIAMPFEVAKVLLQVQWIPKDCIEGETAGTVLEESAEEGDKDDSMSEASVESYFHDPARAAFSAAARNEPESSQPFQLTDADGYVTRQSINDESTRPDYVMPVGSAEGVWAMIKRLRSFKPEGSIALWKSLLTSTVLETLTPIVQATLQTLLLGIFVPDSTQLYPIIPSQLPASHIAINLMSHIGAGVLLSPLDLVRTRLIVQSSHPSHKSYTGPIQALRLAMAQEGGLRALYTHPSLLVPAILDNSVRPFIAITTPILLHRSLGIEEDTHPISYALSSFACASAALLVTLPIEIVRRRMQVQTRGTARPIQACVELSPRPYLGVIDAAWRIVAEERATPRVRVRRMPSSRRGSTADGTRRASFKGKEREDVGVNLLEEDEFEDDGWFASTGISQLYRGFSMNLTANAVVFAIGAFTGFSADGSSNGWTEL